MTTQKA